MTPVIDQHEGLLFTQMVGDGCDRVGRVQAQAKARRHQLRDEPMVDRRRQVDEVDPVGETFLLHPGDCDREARLSDPARADEGHQRVRIQATHDCFNVVLAADQVLGLGQDGRLGHWIVGPDPHHLDRSDEPVSASDDRRNVGRSREGVVQGPPDAPDVDLQVPLVDEGARPGEIEQVVLPDLLARTRQQQMQDVAGPAAELDRPTRSRQERAARDELERAKQEGDVGDRSSPHWSRCLTFGTLSAVMNVQREAPRRYQRQYSSANSSRHHTSIRKQAFSDRGRMLEAGFRGEFAVNRVPSSSQHSYWGSLHESGLVKPSGHKEALGCPTLWVMTPRFLSQFGLQSLRDLPGSSLISGSATA